MKFKRFLTYTFFMIFVSILAGCSSEEVLMPEIVEIVRPPTSITPSTKKIIPEQSAQKLKGRTVVLDAGHGGHDPGCGEVGYSMIPEKTLVLAIAKDIETQLKAHGSRVIMTRTADYFVPL